MPDAAVSTNTQCRFSQVLLMDSPNNKTKFFNRYGVLLQPKMEQDAKGELCTSNEEKPQTSAAWSVWIDAAAERQTAPLTPHTPVATFAPDTSDDTLRPYQTEAIENICKAWAIHRHVMLQMPTGTGKTRLFVSLINSLILTATDSTDAPTPSFLIITHREELVSQISETLTSHYALDHGIMQGNHSHHTDHPVLVASIQSLTKHLDRALPLRHYSYIIIDEAHHSLADSYSRLWQVFAQARILGVTATPYRLKKSSFQPLYDTLIMSWPMRRLIDEGYLANYRLFTVSEHKAAVRKINRLTKFGADGDYKVKDLHAIVAQTDEIDFLYQAYAAHATGRRGLVYAVNREHAALIAEHFVRQGVRTVAIGSHTPSSVRKQTLADFRSGAIDVIVNVELFTEGFDCPSISFVLLARPTRSLTMYMQQVGRALRPSPDGQPVVILDCVGLRHRFGLPDRKREWTAHFRGEKPALEAYEKRSLGEQDCFAMLREVKREACTISKPRKEIQPSDTGVHVYFDNNYQKYGLCDDSGNDIEPALYDEIHASPYGWYQGSKRDMRQFYPVIFNREGRECLVCSSLTKTAFNVYEAQICGGIIRFNLHLQLKPESTLECNGVTIYQLSHNATPLYATSLDMAHARIFRSCQTWGDKYILLDRGVRHLPTWLIDASRNCYELESLRSIQTLDNVEYAILRNGTMLDKVGNFHILDPRITERSFAEYLNSFK